MDTGRPDSEGNYALSGSASDPMFMVIEPMLRIRHKCVHGAWVRY